MPPIMGGDVSQFQMDDSGYAHLIRIVSIADANIHRDLHFNILRRG